MSKAHAPDPTTGAVEPDALERLLTTKEVAALLAVDPRTVRRMIKSGDLAVRRFGRNVRVERAELRRFIRSS